MVIHHRQNYCLHAIITTTYYHAHHTVHLSHRYLVSHHRRGSYDGAAQLPEAARSAASMHLCQSPLLQHIATMIKHSCRQRQKETRIAILNLVLDLRYAIGNSEYERHCQAGIRILATRHS